MFVSSAASATSRLTRTPLPQFATAAEAEDWLIQLFIRINQLDATLADVPTDGTGARDCYPAWNAELIQ